MRKYIVIFLVCLVLYALFGFLAAPRILTAKLPEIVQNNVAATLSLGSVQVNPFTLSVTAQQVELNTTQGDPLAAAEQIHVNLQASSLVRRALYLKKIDLTGPRVSAQRNQAGQFNLSTLLPEPADQPEPQSTPLRVKVDEFTLRAGNVGFAEQRDLSPFETLLDELQITVQDLDTLPEHQGQFSFQVGTEDGGTLAMTGQLSVDPLVVSVAVDLQNLPLPLIGRYLDQSLPIAIADGALSSQFDLRFVADPLSVNLSSGTAQVSSLAVRTADTQEELSSVEQLNLSGLAVAYPQQTVAIQSLSLTGGQTAAWLNEDGSPSWDALVPANTDDAEQTAPWVVDIAQLQLSEYDLRFTDRSLQNVASLALSNINLSAAPVSTKPGSVSELSLQASPGPASSMSLSGTLTPLSPALDAELTISQLPLSQVQPFLSEHTGLVLKDGMFSTNGRLLLEPSAGLPDDNSLSFSGQLQVDRFALADAVSGDSLSSWTSMVVNQLTLETNPPKVQIDSIELSEPFARVIIQEDRSTNLQAAFASPRSGDDVSEPSTESPAESPATPAEVPANIAVGAVDIQGGSLFFSDRSLTPRFETGIEDLNGRISQLSSESLTKAEVDLSGSVDRYAPVSIKGQINPLSETAFTDITLDFDGIELTTFSPYSGRFAGHRIRKGKLNLDLRYKLNASLLEGENRIFLNQLALGDRVESPDATGLPVSLAIALLKDRDGNIDLDIPVRGDLDDPEFSLGGVVLKAFVGLITKVVTSPFGIFGKLIPGGGEDLQYVDFAPGAANLDSAQLEKLSGLAEGLYQRPGLSLEIAGKAHPDVDGIVLARRAFTESQGLAEADFDSDAYWNAVRTAAGAEQQAAAGAAQEDAEVVAPAPDLAALEADLLADLQPSDDDLRTLASQRAQAIREALFEAQAIEPERVFLLAPVVVPGGGEPLVRIEMSLGSGS